MPNTKEIFNKYSKWYVAHADIPLMNFDDFNEALGEILSLPVELPVKPEIAKIVRDILQEGANIAMYGNPFESEEGVIKEQERLYDKAIKDYTTLLQKQFSV